MSFVVKKMLRDHITQILSTFETKISHSMPQSIPLDLHLKYYLTSHKSLGSHDRAIISETIYKLVRYKVYLDTITPKPLTWPGRLNALLAPDFENNLKNPSFKKNVRCSCPPELFNLLSEAYGEGKAFEYCENILEKAPLTIRSNPLKISRDRLLELMKLIDRHKSVERCEFSPYGIKFLSLKNQNLFETNEFKKGFFEIQDEGSQLAAFQVKCQPGQSVLDFCSGSGGKSLAFGPFLKGKGQIFLHDQREYALIKAKKRFQRAGIQNVQFHKDLDALKKYQGKMDWLVLDVPCTGTGTLRRNPDLKWKFSLDLLERMTALQEEIVEKSLTYLKKNGKLVYITCSMLPQENILQINNICKKFSLSPLDSQHLQIYPEKGGMDCFFAKVLVKS